MAENVYEGMFSLDSNHYGRDPEGVAGQVAQMIERAGGSMLVSRLWEERRLAYPIKGQRRGTYWLTYFRLDSERLAEVQRQYQLSENVLRALVLRIDPRIVDALVAHAQTSQPAAPSEPAAKPAVEADETWKPEEDEDAVGVADADEEEEP